MKKLIVIALIVIILASCSPTKDENPVEPSPVPLNQASTIEEARVASLPGNSTEENREETGEDNDDDHEDGVVEAEKVASSGSVNLNDLTPESETGLTEEGGVVQPAPGVPNTLTKIEQKVLQDLANHLGVQVEEIEVLSGDEVEWSDGSLGCPDEEMMYIQVITPGYLFILEVDGQEYEYHTDLQDQLILCIDGRPAAAP